VGRMEQAGARTSRTALGDYFKGDLGQLRLYARRDGLSAREGWPPP
jgi:hypothetical protein